jgi:predicted O-methyltransferase YrrM
MDLVPGAMRLVMERLRARDARDRADGTPQWQRLRAITPDVGQFLLTLALAVGARRIVEVGTSSGYSTLWLALAARRNGGRVTTFEIDTAKVALATRTFAEAGVAGVIDLRAEDSAAPRTSSSSTPRSGTTRLTSTWPWLPFGRAACSSQTT